MQPAHLGNFDHAAQGRKLDRSADRCVFFERQMRPATFVVLEIFFQNATQPRLIEDNDVVEAFAPNGTVRGRSFARDSGEQSELRACPSISLSHKTSVRKHRRGRAANTAGRYPKEKPPQVDALSIRRSDWRSRRNESDGGGHGRE